MPIVHYHWFPLGTDYLAIELLVTLLGPVTNLAITEGVVHQLLFALKREKKIKHQRLGFYWRWRRTLE
jgi:hypothetical protein